MNEIQVRALQDAILDFPEAPYLTLSYFYTGGGGNPPTLLDIEVALSNGAVYDPHYSLARYGKPTKGWRQAIESMLCAEEHKNKRYSDMGRMLNSRGIYLNASLRGEVGRGILSKDPYKECRNKVVLATQVLTGNPGVCYADLERVYDLPYRYLSVSIANGTLVDPHKETRPYYGLTPRERMSKRLDEDRLRLEKTHEAN